MRIERKINQDFFLFLNLFAKDDELSVFLLGQSSHYFGDLQGSEGFIVLPSHFHVNATVCSHGKGSADGLLSEGEIKVKGGTRIIGCCCSTITICSQTRKD